MDRGAWRAIVHGVKELDATEATWHSQHAHRHFPCLPAPSSVLSLCISSLLTVRTTSESSEPMMLFRGIPSSAWGIYKRPHLLLGLLQLSSSQDEFQPCSWNPVLSLQLMVLLVKSSALLLERSQFKYWLFQYHLNKLWQGIWTLWASVSSSVKMGIMIILLHWLLWGLLN